MDLGIESLPAGERWSVMDLARLAKNWFRTRAEVADRYMTRDRGKLYKVHKAGDGKHSRGFAGEVCAGGCGLVACLVIKENPALPVV